MFAKAVDDVHPLGIFDLMLQLLERKVNDIVMMNFFGRHTPYSSIILWLGSPSRGKLSFCFSRKLASAFSGSALTPRMATFSLSKRLFASRNSDASVVQPGVFALGKKNITTRLPLKSFSDSSFPVSLFSVNSGALSPIFNMPILSWPAAFSIFHLLLVGSPGRASF